MKVFYICDTDLGLENASVVHIMEVVNNLNELNCDVTLFTPRMREYHQKTSAKIKYLKIINKPVLWVVSYEIILFFSLFYFILKKKPDVIYVRQSDSLLSPFLVSNLLRVPIVIENNGDLEKEARLLGCSLIRIKGLKIVEKICYRLASKIVTVAPTIKKNIITKYNINHHKVTVIRNGVNTNLFRPLNIEKVRREQRLSSDSYYLGYVGNLAVWQGLEYLIKSLPYVLKKIPNVKCLIVGDGNEKGKLEILVKQLKLEKNIIFTGSVPYHVVPKYINAFDICVAPFIKEKNGDASPLKLYEYFSCGKPVIVSNIREVGFLLKDLVSIAEPEDARDLADKIIELIESPQLRKQLGRKVRSFVLRGHSWRDVAYKTSKILQEAIKNSNGI